MSLLVVELSDAGIMVAGGDPPQLLKIDGSEIESPGFAVAKKKQIIVGKQAEKQAHLHPNTVQNRFWDQLNTDHIKELTGPAQNNAEIACAHLAMIWEKIKFYGSEMMISVPGSMSRTQMGLILGVAQELSIHVKGFVTQAVASPPHSFPESRLLYMDIYLHRTEITPLIQGERLSQGETVTLGEAGLMHLYRSWVEALAEEFVRTTRFDPLHRAEYEQELYDRLPDVLSHLSHNSTMRFEMRARQTVHNVTLTRDLLNKRAEPFFKRVRGLVVSALEGGGNEKSSTLILSNRIARLPGIEAIRKTIDSCRTVELEAGGCALNVFRNREQFESRSDGSGASYFTSRPWRVAQQLTKTKIQGVPFEQTPTHLLYRDLAYPITSAPIFIGREPVPEERSLTISNTQVSRKHCSVRQEGEDIVLTVYSSAGTYVNENRVEGSSRVTLGQIIRIGNSKETVRLIASLDADET
ncbi:FHA domain-containing protein [Thermodesulfobacteriota bacterium]